MYRAVGMAQLIMPEEKVQIKSLAVYKNSKMYNLIDFNYFLQKCE